MGVYIKGLELPKDGETVVIVISNENGKTLAEVDEYCGAVYESFPVPPHGDLIDRDALLFDNSEAFHDIDWYTNAAWEAVDNAPTVLEAEGKDDG